MGRAFNRPHCFGIEDANLLKQFEVAMDAGESCIQSPKIIVHGRLTGRIKINLSHCSSLLGMVVRDGVHVSAWALPAETVSVEVRSIAGYNRETHNGPS